MKYTGFYDNISFLSLVPAINIQVKWKHCDFLLGNKQKNKIDFNLVTAKVFELAQYQTRSGIIKQLTSLTLVNNDIVM